MRHSVLYSIVLINPVLTSVMFCCFSAAVSVMVESSKLTRALRSVWKGDFQRLPHRHHGAAYACHLLLQHMLVPQVISHEDTVIEGYLGGRLHVPRPVEGEVADAGPT